MVIFTFAAPDWL